MRQRGTLIKSRSGKPIRLYFKYERMPNFCYLCGADCEPHEDGDVERMPCGDWLRASPVKETRKVRRA